MRGDKHFKAKGKAHVTGPDAAKYEFGFLQLGRPFEAYRGTWHKLGADPAFPGNDLKHDATMSIRKYLPALDHSTPWFGASAFGPNAEVAYDDNPGTPFEVSVGRGDDFYYLSGLLSTSFLFTAFAVKGPDGVFRPLRTFYWGLNYCEDIPPGTDYNKEKTGNPFDVAPVRDCLAGPCDESEPGFSKVNDPRTADTYVAATTNGLNDAPWEGPGTFKIECSS